MDNQPQVPVSNNTLSAPPNPSTPPLPSIPSHSKTKWPVMFAIILVFITITSAGLFLFQQSKNPSKPEVIPTILPTTQPTEVPTLLPTQTVTISAIPTSHPTTNWKTYTSKNKILSFQYPPSYEIDDKGTADIDLIRYKEDRKAKITTGQPELPSTGWGDNLLIGIQISFDPIDANIPVQKYVDEQIHLTKESACIFEISNKTNIIVDGVEGVRYLWNQPGRIDGSGENVVFIHQGNVISIGKFPQKTDLQAEFNQILSTFRFLGNPS